MSKNEKQTILVRFVVGFLFAVLYAASALLFEVSSFFQPPEGTGTKFRPAIFMLAITSVIFGPTVGFVTGSVGNLLFDIVADVMIGGEVLEPKHVVGLLANGLGGFLLGVFAKEVDINKIKRVKDILLSKVIIFQVFWNTILSIIFFGGFVAIFIAIGKPLVEGDNYITAGISTFGIIFYWNSTFLLMAIPIFFLAYLFMSLFSEKRKLKRIEKLKTFKIYDDKDKDESQTYFKIASVKVIGETELLTRHWNQVQISFRHSYPHPISVSAELCGAESFHPDNFFLPSIEPEKRIKMSFSLLPLAKGFKQMRLKLNPWYTKESSKDDSTTQKDTFSPFEYKLGYNVNRMSTTYFNQIWSFALVAISVITFFLTLQEIL
ncbi:MAG: ECF transporter S component, partial [Candidatus Hodarchaeales archaeon]